MDRIEVSFRAQLGYCLGRRSAFAYRDPANFIDSFGASEAMPGEEQPTPSKLQVWLTRTRERQDGSHEDFVAHSRESYDDQMPIWAVTKILELGQLSRLYKALIRSPASEIADAYDVPSKTIMASWVAGMNYVRNLEAHRARLFNRKLVVAPMRPKRRQIPLLDHLRAETTAKGRFGAYSAFAVMAYLVRTIDSDCGWDARLKDLLRRFPAIPAIATAAIGVPDDWESLDLWS